MIDLATADRYTEQKIRTAAAEFIQALTDRARADVMAVLIGEQYRTLHNRYEERALTTRATLSAVLDEEVPDEAAALEYCATILAGLLCDHCGLSFMPTSDRPGSEPGQPLTHNGIEGHACRRCVTAAAHDRMRSY